ncbi:hypothetical protein PAMP_019776 [Pampus punctatissimus]
MKHLIFFGIAFAVFHISHSQLATEVCQLPADEGVGASFIFSLYFDAGTQQCTPFLYKGQGGNGNRFRNEAECVRNCSADPDNLYPMDPREACHFPKAAGNCGGTALRFYYDSIHDKCKKFLWTGCVGNGNRFQDQMSCNTTCVGIHDEGDAQEEDEPDTPIAIICGVLLATIVASVLITVIVLTVKSKKKASMKAQGKSKGANIPLQEQGGQVVEIP